MRWVNTCIKRLLLCAWGAVGLRARAQALIFARGETTAFCQFSAFHRVAVLLHQRQPFLLVADQPAVGGDVHLQQLHPLNTSCGVFGQQPSQQFFCILTHGLFGRELELCFLEDFDQFWDGGGLKGTKAI